MVEIKPSITNPRQVESEISLAFRKVFNVLEPEEEGFLLGSADLHLYEAGEVIVEQNAPFSGIYVIVDGEARVEIRNGGKESRDRVDLARLGRGDIFGEVSFVDQQPTSARVIAETNMDILVIGEDLIRSMFFADPTFARRFYHSIAVTLAKRLRETNPKVLVSPGTHH